MKGHMMAWPREALGLVLEEECFETTIYFLKKRKHPFSCYRLSFSIIGVQKET